MPTTNFPGSNPAIVFSPKSTFTTTFAGGYRYVLLTGQASAIDTVVTGTACTISAYNGGGFWKVVVDGVTSSLTFDQDNTWSKITLFTGLEDAPHRVTVYVGGNHEYVEYDTHEGLLQVTGSNPAISVAPGYSQNQWALADESVSPHIGSEGLNVITGGGYSGLLNADGSGAAFRFRASAQSIKVWGFTRGQTLYFGIDGKPFQQPVVLPDNNTYQWVDIPVPDDLDFHEYIVYMGYKSSAAGQGVYWHTIMTDGGEGLDLNWTPPAKKCLALYGDSITEGVSDSVTLGVFGYLFDEYNGDIIKTANRAVSGSTVTTRGVSSTSKITSTVPTPTWCVVHYGTNDFDAGVTSSDFQTAFYTMMDSLTTGLPNTQFFVLGILPRSDKNVATSGFNEAIQAAIAALTDDQQAQITYIDPAILKMSGESGTDFTTNYLDGLHPNLKGNKIIYNALLSYLGFVGMEVSPRLQHSRYDNSSEITATLFGGTGAITADTNVGTLSTSNPGNGVPFVLYTPASGEGIATVSITGPAGMQDAVHVKYGNVDARSALTPAIVFKVTLTSPAVFSSVQAAHQAEYLYQESTRKISIPGIGWVNNNDTFTLYGQEAVSVRDIYATGANAVLTVIG